MNEPEMSPAPDRVLIAWSAPEFIDHPRGKTWFLVAGLFIAGIVAYSLFTGSITTAVVFLLLAGVYLLTHKQTPRIIDIQITELGIQIDRKFYPYNALRSFWIIYRPPFVRTLYFQTTDRVFSKLSIQMDAQSPLPVQEVLSQKLPEVEGAKESFTDLCSRLFRL